MTIIENFIYCKVCGKIIKNPNYNQKFCSESCRNKSKKYRKYQREWKRKYRIEHYEEYRAYQNQWNKKNPEKTKAKWERWYQKNKDEYNARRRERLATDEEYRRKEHEYYKKWARRNPEKILAQQKEYREKNKEKLRKNKKDFYHQNKELMRNRAIKQRERIKNDPKLLAKYQKYQREYRRKIRHQFLMALGGKCSNPKCNYSKIVEILEVHHINPEEKEGGRQSEKDAFEFHRTGKVPEDVILLCPTCHREEHYRIRNGLERKFSSTVETQDL